MSANNYIKIEEISLDKFRVSEKDYESDLDIQHLGDFNFIRLAIDKAENHIKDLEYEVEYGIRFSLIDKDLDSKDFDKWNSKKKKAELEEKRLYTTREIWWCRLGVNIGFEQDGSGEEFLRPCVIIREFGPRICMVIPLTSSPNKHHLRIPVGLVDTKHASALLSQIRSIDTRRHVEKIGFLDKEKFEELRKNARNLF
ncbi:MAG: type II toxin-antitoxin system PemK/MazF family toxin [Candidatus Paceibacterota bacterium]|jgi:mRNA interferase MazF